MTYLALSFHDAEFRKEILFGPTVATPRSLDRLPIIPEPQEMSKPTYMKID